jgi:hypothetical protein
LPPPKKKIPATIFINKYLSPIGVPICLSAQTAGAIFPAQKLSATVVTKRVIPRQVNGKALFCLGLFAFGFVEFRFDDGHLRTFTTYRYHLMPTKTALLVSFVFASIAFYVESGKRK